MKHLHMLQVMLMMMVFICVSKCLIMFMVQQQVMQVWQIISNKFILAMLQLHQLQIVKMVDVQLI